MTTHAKRSQTLLKCKDRRLIMSEAIVSGRVKPTCSAMRKVKLLGLLEDYSAILFLLFKPSSEDFFCIKSRPCFVRATFIIGYCPCSPKDVSMSANGAAIVENIFKNAIL